MDMRRITLLFLAIFFVSLVIAIPYGENQPISSTESTIKSNGYHGKLPLSKRVDFTDTYQKNVSLLNLYEENEDGIMVLKEFENIYLYNITEINNTITYTDNGTIFYYATLNITRTSFAQDFEY